MLTIAPAAPQRMSRYYEGYLRTNVSQQLRFELRLAHQTFQHQAGVAIGQQRTSVPGTTLRLQEGGRVSEYHCYVRWSNCRFLEATLGGARQGGMTASHLRAREAAESELCPLTERLPSKQMQCIVFRPR